MVAAAKEALTGVLGPLLPHVLVAAAAQAAKAAAAGKGGGGSGPLPAAAEPLQPWPQIDKRHLAAPLTSYSALLDAVELTNKLDAAVGWLRATDVMR